MTGNDAVTMPLQASNVIMFKGEPENLEYSKFYGKLDKNEVGIWVGRLFQ